MEKMYRNQQEFSELSPTHLDDYVLIVVVVGDTSVGIKWTVPNGTLTFGAPLKSFVIYMGSSNLSLGLHEEVLDTAVTTYRVTSGIVAGRAYYFQVAIKSAAAEGNRSEMVEVRRSRVRSLAWPFFIIGSSMQRNGAA